MSKIQRHLKELFSLIYSGTSVSDWIAVSVKYRRDSGSKRQPFSVACDECGLQDHERWISHL